LSPGMKYRHYAPEAELVLVRGSFADFADYVKDKPKQNTYCLCFDGEEDKLPMPAFSYGTEGDGVTQAHNIMTLLRHLDKIGAQKVYVRCPQSQGVSLAVYNRLLRAAAFRIIELSHKN
ncbi:MAG: translation factor SUA5, partial [Clostridia bacterium]|nr:translation factor SUA5 [Clostridia bacterium]